MEKVLIIEDEPAILLGLKDELSQYYQTFTATNGKDGLKIARESRPDLILLDLILPDIDGFRVCELLMVTARDQVIDKVKGLELGADDYITKPFSLDELKARIKAVLRRRKLTTNVETYKDGVLDIDFTRLRALKKRKALKLSPLEFKLLRFLVSRQGEVISRRRLLEQVWGYEITPSTRTVDVHIRSLRKKLNEGYITTVHGEGYRFDTN